MIVTNSLTGGGAERSMNLVANELSRRGWAVSLVPINAGPPDIVTPICEVFPLERKWKGGVWGTVAAMKRFNGIVGSWNPDVLVLNCSLPELFGTILIRKSQLVVVEHASAPWGFRTVLGRVVRRLLQGRKTIWVAVSSHLKIWPNQKSPFCIMQNPAIPLTQGVLNLPKSEIKRLVFIGRLSPEKRPEIALELAHRSVIDLVVIGDGDLRASLEERALTMATKVIFRGQISNPWLEIQSNDLLIIPSLFEGDGLVVIEALQRNVPMLLAEIVGFRRFGFPEVNYCVDVDEFCAKVEAYRTDISKLLIHSEIADKITSPRSLQLVGDSWEAFLNQIL